MPDRFIPERRITDQSQGIVSVSGSRLPTDDALSAFAAGGQSFLHRSPDSLLQEPADTMAVAGRSPNKIAPMQY